MRGLFIHDHKFPSDGERYYYSYGFDEEFFRRYLSIFDELNIIGRVKKQKSLSNDFIVNEGVNFNTISNLKELKQKETRKRILEDIKKSDYLVIRLPSILGFYAVKWAERYNKPYLIEVVGCPWDALANKGYMQIPIALIITLLMKRTVLKAKNVVYVTEKFLQRRYPTRGKQIACSNVTLRNVDEEDLLNRLDRIKNHNGEKIILGTCATIDVIYKGQEDVIKAISKLKQEGFDIEYQLVGGGSKTYLESVATKYGVLDQIKFIGTLKHDDVFNWLEQIDIYVHPSKQEGLSRAIIEAMSKGCPIFAANAGGIHEQIDRDFIFEKGNVQAICEIYKKFTPEIMELQSKKNHENSKKYLKHILYDRRKKFFNEFIND